MDYLNEYYENYNEEGRLSRKYGIVEYTITMKYIHKYLKEVCLDTGRILEIGAGTGRYTIALAREGYRVDAIEYVQCNLDQLKAKIIDTDRINAQQGNAIDLSRYDDKTFDVTLLLGPMYHLYTKEDMARALKEAVRVTKVNGYICVAYCMNEASLIQCGFFGKHILDYYQKHKISDDFHCLSTPEDLFVLVRVEEINELNKMVSVERQILLATDGPTGYLRNQIDEMTEEEFQLLLKYQESVCERQDLIGATNHSLDILKRLE